jgi:hypothetical protein
MFEISKGFPNPGVAGKGDVAAREDAGTPFDPTSTQCDAVGITRHRFQKNNPGIASWAVGEFRV